jgi:hypothetical protein
MPGLAAPLGWNLITGCVYFSAFHDGPLRVETDPPKEGIARENNDLPTLL